MANSFVQVPPDSTGKNIDAASLDVGATAVQRQRIVIGDNSATAEFAIIAGGAMTIAGTVNISTMPAIVIGDINAISRTVLVAGVVSFAAGALIDSISATVGVKGQVSLAAGTSNIGSINNISATVVVVGTVSLGAGTNLIGAVSNAAGTALMGAVSLAAGTANIGFINNISATVVIAGAVTFTTGQVSLAAGTSNIGFINNISATVVTGLSYVIEKTSNSQVQIGDSANAAMRVNVVAGAAGGVSQIDGTTFTSQAANFVPIGGIFDDGSPDTLSENDAGIVRMTTNRAFHVNLRDAAGAAISGGNALSVKVENISATVIVAGVVSFGPGTSNIGSIFGNAQPTKYSASWGPKTVVVSTSANVTLVASPGAGNHIYVTMLAATNGSGTLSRADIYQSLETGSTIAKMSLAASGGGFVIHYNPPVKLESATALTGRVKPNASDCYFNIHFYVGS